MLRALREASGPLTSRDLADMWCQERGLTAKDSTISMLRKRIGATLKALEHKGAVRQEGHVEGRIGWRLTPERLMTGQFETWGKSTCDLAE